MRFLFLYVVLRGLSLATSFAADEAGNAIGGNDNLPTISRPAMGRIQWARLKTNYQFWNRHADTETNFIQYIRTQTSLDIDPNWAIADVNHLEQMTAYPFLYTEGIQTVTDPQAQNNLREYLIRGGFLMIEACIYPAVNPSPDHFYEMQAQRLHEILPEATISALPNTHEIYSNYFKINRALEQATFQPDWLREPMYAVQYQGRLSAFISLAAMKCGWSFPDPPNASGHRVEAMRLMVNLYVYAATH